ncbi:MAG: hypothetical protein ACK40X_02235 [Armatimonadota bacterium]
MARSELELKEPQFTVDEKGKTMVILDEVSYIALLVRGNITDPSLWPPGTEKGAEALARIRRIEADCVAQHGEFDWEKLPAELRDEYDALCAFLDKLMDAGKRISLDELLASEG